MSQRDSGACRARPFKEFGTVKLVHALDGRVTDVSPASVMCLITSGNLWHLKYPLFFFPEKDQGTGRSCCLWPSISSRASRFHCRRVSVVCFVHCLLPSGGGLVTATRVIVLRRYPTLFVSGDFGGKGGDGSGGGGVAESSKARRRVLSEAEEEVRVTLRPIEMMEWVARFVYD